MIKKARTKTEAGRDLMLRQTGRPLPSAAVQLDLFTEFARSTPQKYTHTLELFDAIPKFAFGSKTSLKAKNGALEIVKRDFEWNSGRYRVTIRPTVLEAKGKGGVEFRKEILPGTREEAVYRVLRKMASDPSVERSLRGDKEVSVVMRFTMSNLRARLAEVGHGMKAVELKESLQVLGLTPLMLLNLDTRREIFSSNSYITVDYVTDENDVTGERTVVEVSFNRLAALAIIQGLTDWVNYERLMSLHDPLAQWIYETMTRNFRQAGVDYGYKLTLKRILAESPMRATKLRQNVVRVRQSLKRLIDHDILSAFPPYTQTFTYDEAPRKTGRKSIADVEWIIHPSAEVIADIKGDNARKATQRLKAAHAG